MTPIEITLAIGKETKGTYRFETDDPEAPITTLYLRKSAFEGKTPPETIRLLVEAK